MEVLFSVIGIAIMLTIFYGLHDLLKGRHEERLKERKRSD
mgnify:CR=1 FL=1